MSTALPAASHVALRSELFSSPGSGLRDHEPVVSGSRESTVSIRVVRGLIEVVEQAGAARAELLRAAQIRPEQLHAGDGRVERAKMYRLSELAIELTGDPALGLHWAETLNESVFAPVSHLMMHAPTLRHGFAALTQFYRLLSDDPGHELIETGDEVTMRALPLWGESECVQRFGTEMMVAGMYRLIRDFSMQARPGRVSFAYAAPAYQAEYTRVFGAPVAFQQSFSGIVFDRELLDLPAPHKDEEVHEALQALAERRLLHITQSTPYALRVREFLVRQGGPHRTDMEAAARAVGLSVRSLRRRLTDEGNPYQAVANEALLIVAKHFLCDKQRTIQEAAYAMGFSDARTFHRAFRRWTGTTPSAYRAAQLEERGEARAVARDEGSDR